MAQVSKDPPDVSSEVIESGKLKTKSKKKGGPYSKSETVQRLDEVYRLHFEYGYSAREISELINVNRNTVNHDISSLYLKLKDEMDRDSVDDWINKELVRYESQRARLRNELDNDITLQEKLVVEKMIFAMDSKISSLLVRLKLIGYEGYEFGVSFLNDWLKKNGFKDRIMSKDSLLRIPEKSRKKIYKLLDLKPNGKN